MAKKPTYKELEQRIKSEDALVQSEKRYCSLFQDSPVSLWELDVTGLVKYVDALKNSGVTDLMMYLHANRAAVTECARSIKVHNVNKQTLNFLGVDEISFTVEQGHENSCQTVFRG